MSVVYQETGIKNIRLEYENGVSHFSTKYYHVVFDDELREDHLKLINDKNILHRVQAMSQDKSTIT